MPLLDLPMSQQEELTRKGVKSAVSDRDEELKLPLISMKEEAYGDL